MSSFRFVPRTRKSLIPGVALLALVGVTLATSAAPAAAARRRPRPAPVVSPSPSPSPTSSTAPIVLLEDDFSSLATGTWPDGSTNGQWTLTYNGYGSAGVEDAESRMLTGAPKVSTQPAETHAILFNSVKQFTDLDATVRMKTVSMLRSPSPNPWEVSWFLWHYTDDTHFYSVVLKPNGWELGKEDPAYPGAQRYLQTGTKQFPVGAWYTVRVVQVGATMTVYVDGVQLVTYTDTERPYTGGGSIGLYSEDAHVHFDDVRVLQP